MKECKKCGAIKELSEFYAQNGRPNGSCKECVKSRVRENRKKNLDYYREYDAARFKNDPKVKERHKRYQSSERGKEVVNALTKRWIKNNPRKRKAHCALNNAVRDGKLTKPTECQECGASGKIHGHHHDYDKPLDVVWVCPQCHRDIHNTPLER